MKKRQDMTNQLLMETIKLEMQQRNTVAHVRETKRTRGNESRDVGRNSDLQVSKAR